MATRITREQLAGIRVTDYFWRKLTPELRTRIQTEADVLRSEITGTTRLAGRVYQPLSALTTYELIKFDGTRQLAAAFRREVAELCQR